MKRNKLNIALSLLAVGSMLTACSSDYLDLAPESTVSKSDITATVEGAQLAVNGICSAMQTQYQSTSYNQYNGESWMNTIYNETLGQDDLQGLGLSMWGDEISTGGAPWQKDNYVLNAVPWGYCYNIIQQANAILDGIDNAEGDKAKRNFVKAQALTFRAFGYTKLMQYYAPRWEDSRNGEAVCAVMRTKGNADDAPLCTENEVMELIYKDLNEAIELYKSSGASREYKWQPDLSVAYGVFARAALIKNDWPTAQEMAHNARQGYSIMDNNTYLAGFMDDNNDFMWIQASNDADIYYWSYGSHFAVNGLYVKNWGEGAGAINMDLYRQLDPNDIRRQLYLTPDKADFLTNLNSSWNRGKIKEEDFWNPNLVVESSNCDLSSGPSTTSAAIQDDKAGRKVWGLVNLAIRYCWYYGNNIFQGDFDATQTETADGFFTAYYLLSSDASAIALGGGKSGILQKCPLGAQFKFWSYPNYGTSAYPFMRASEMCLTEAEAAYHNGDMATALKCLKEINDKRIPGYAFAGSGEDLLNEIRLCRRIELWGEGFSWPDFKRWNLDIVRRAWVAYDATSGNWMSDYAKTTPASANGGWRMLIPRSEYEYNHAIDRSKLESNN